MEQNGHDAGFWAAVTAALGTIGLWLKGQTSTQGLRSRVIHVEGVANAADRKASVALAAANQAPTLEEFRAVIREEGRSIVENFDSRISDVRDDLKRLDERMDNHMQNHSRA